jgi:hypothetical protein
VGPNLKLSFFETYLSCVAGAFLAAFIFYFSSEFFLKRAHQARKEKIRKALETGIELKYKTIKRNIKFSDEEFFLKNHAAQNLGRFDFFDDLRRLQMLRKQGIIHSGFVIFLTNDPLYWTRIQRSNFSSNFSMEEGRVIEKNTALSWVGNPSENSVTPKRLGEHANIEIENELCLTWKTYSEFEESLFKHLIVQI